MHDKGGETLPEGIRQPGAPHATPLTVLAVWLTRLLGQGSGVSFGKRKSMSAHKQWQASHQDVRHLPITAVGLRRWQTGNLSARDIQVW